MDVKHLLKEQPLNTKHNTIMTTTIAKLIKDGFVNLIGLLCGLVAVYLMSTAISGLIVEVTTTVIARVATEYFLSTTEEEIHHEVSCDIIGFGIANTAVALGGLVGLAFPFMGAVVAMSCTNKIVKFILAHTS